jgi:PIN domain
MSIARAAGLLKAVLDTNVYFSAFSSTRRVPFELWRRALRREFTVLTSPAILRELAEVLRTDLKWPELDIVAQLKLVAKVAKLVEPTSAVSAVADDPIDQLPIWEQQMVRNRSYLPMQKVEKMRFKMSSAVVAPVIASMGRSAAYRSNSSIS